MSDRLTPLMLDLEELASRGFGHPDAQQIVGRLRVGMQQLDADVEAPPPPADPVQDQLAQVRAAVGALAERVGPVLERQGQTLQGLDQLAERVARLSDLVQALANGKAANSAPADGT